MLVINIKNSATCFGSLSHHQAKYKTVPVHSVRAHIMGSNIVHKIVGAHNVCTRWMYRYCGLYLAWWWLNEPKHVANF